MKAAIRTVVFDFEGTLVDFQWQLDAAHAQLRRAFAEHGFAVDGNYARMWNAAAEQAAAQGRLAALRRALHPVYDRWDADALARWSPRPGAAALLRRLAAQGVAAALVSNVGRAALEPALQRFGLRQWLQPVVSRDDVLRLKPAPEGVLAALAATRTAATAALFVGDSLADIAAARAAGLRVAIVRGGEVPAAELDAAQPDWVVDGLDEVAGLVAAMRGDGA